MIPSKWSYILISVWISASSFAYDLTRNCRFGTFAEVKSIVKHDNFRNPNNGLAGPGMTADKGHSAKYQELLDVYDDVFTHSRDKYLASREDYPEIATRLMHWVPMGQSPRPENLKAVAEVIDSMAQLESGWGLGELVNPDKAAARKTWQPGLDRLHRLEDDPRIPLAVQDYVKKLPKEVDQYSIGSIVATMNLLKEIEEKMLGINSDRAREGR